jgi:MYXO-CTERM domain-containing protein
MKGGDFGFAYGASFSAQGQVNISVLGESFSWQGNLPYVPQFDLEVQADQPFDAWGYAPGVTLSSTTMPQQIASIDISSIIGGSIPGVDGGFALDVAVELDATYVTDRIVCDTTDGNAVPGGPITTPDGTSSVPFVKAAYLELDVHPEGTVSYSGVVHMIPTFYVSLLGNKWDIPIVDVPISFPIAQEAWVFTPERVHVPVPDLAIPVTELDFGDVYVGMNRVLQYELRNAGEAEAEATMATSDATVFPLLGEKTTLASGQSDQAEVDFIPQTAGAFTGHILVVSNDPATPLQIVALKGVGVAPVVPTQPPPPPPPHTTTPKSPSTPEEEGTVDQPSGCACRTGGEGPGGGLGVGVTVLAALAWSGRSRRRRAR